MARGKLKIFFGAFPGAGKTGAMLQAARRMRDAGRQVVIGFLDLHGEESDAPLAEGLERLPGAERALDLDGALARRPDVLLVDDLAFSNPAGARHPKRWHDVDELLANGIDVYTTMSVQHIESLNDVVAEITGIPEPETVPDTFFDSADETIMVDMPADELLLRLAQGSVPVGHVDAGPGGRLFEKASLLALREIALRRVADVVEEEVRRVRAAGGTVAATWKTHGRLLVCIGPDPGSEHTVRSAARLARALGEEWTAVYVETPALQRLPAAERGRILNVVSLAGELGARTAILTGQSVADAVIEYAREANISTFVVGRGTRRRLPFERTMAEAIAAGGDDLDVIEIGRGAEGGAPVAAPALRPEAPGARRGEKRVRYAWTALACLAATLVLMQLAFDLATVAMLYMLTVVLVGVVWGRGPAILAAALDVAAFDFFFVPPRFTFLPGDIQHYITYAVMLAVGTIIGQLAGGIRYQASVATHRERRARTLYEFARDIAALGTTSEVIGFVEGFMERHFRARAAVLVPDVTGALASPTGRAMNNPSDGSSAQWAYDQSRPAGAGTDTLAGAEHIFLPLKSPTRTWGVLAVRPERARDLMIPEQRHQFETFAALAATALERVHYLDVARDALLMARIRAGDLRPAFERLPIRGVIEAALASLSGVLARHPVTTDVPDSLPLASVDPALMQRVFASLGGNVAKHTPAGTSIRIAARAAAGSLEIAFEDSGPGLPAGREEEVFGTFRRGDTPAPRKGAGLGLAISRAIVEAHGGTLRAERREGGGACLVVRLPLGFKGSGYLPPIETPASPWGASNLTP